MSDRIALTHLFDQMKGKQCWSKIGPTAGSWFSLDFGDKVRRRQSITNDRLRMDQREFVGEYGLFVQDAWRLFENGILLCDCNASNKPGAEMEAGLLKFENTTVLDYWLGEAPYEMKLQFSGNIVFQVCRWSENADQISYTLSHGDTYVSVYNNGRIRKGFKTP